MPAPKPPPRADLSDIDRQARTTARAPKPTNPLPFARGNTTERIEAAPPTPRPAAPRRRSPSRRSPQPDASRPLTLPEAPNAHADAPESAQAIAAAATRLRA